MSIPFPIFMMLMIAIISFIILIVQFSMKLGYRKGQREKEQELIVRFEGEKKESLNRQRSVVKGKVSEQLAPFLAGFPFKASECRFLGCPIDLVVFQGMDSGKVESIYLVDIKTDRSRLSPIHKSIAEVVENRKVFWHTYRQGVDDYHNPHAYPGNNHPGEHMGQGEEEFIAHYEDMFSDPSRH